MLKMKQETDLFSEEFFFLYFLAINEKTKVKKEKKNAVKPHNTGMGRLVKKIR